MYSPRKIYIPLLISSWIYIYGYCTLVFLQKRFHSQCCSKAWLTPGLKISRINKRKLYLAQRSSNDPNLTKYYKKYCKVLSCVIKLAKRRCNGNVINRSNNKIKTDYIIILRIIIFLLKNSLVLGMLYRLMMRLIIWLIIFWQH
jgi:hypothetical protein